MTHTHNSGGFSLIEVNMAVFVMAIGILGLVALFPLGLREGVKARADLKQSMFADHALNQIVSILSQPTLKWSDWEKLLADKKGFEGTGAAFQNKLEGFSDTLPKDLSGNTIDMGDTIRANWMIPIERYWIVCKPLEGLPSARILGITVRSADTEDPRPTDSEAKEAWETRHAPYYAEVLFNGDPTK
jgi:hypothetical protein